jgi:hypothetical protein
MKRFASARRGGVGMVALLVLAAGGLAGGGTGAAVQSLTVQISADPYHNAGSAHMTEVEPDSFTWRRTTVATFQVGRFFNGGASNIGFSVSRDSGHSWSDGVLPNTTRVSGGPYDRASDPTVAYDARHRVWMISYLGIDTAGHPAAPAHVDVLVSRSTDGGLHWGDPVAVRLGSPRSFLDKNWTTCDNTPSSRFYGHCYTEWDDNAAHPFNLLSMSTSVDGGATWRAPKHTADLAQGLGGQPVVQPSGRVVVPILSFPDELHANIGAFVSTDGGATWGPMHKVSGLHTFTERGFVRNPDLPSAEVDASGRVFVVFYDCRFETGCSANDIVITWSDNGVDWSPVARLPTGPVGVGADEFTPSIGAGKATSDGAGQLAVQYYSFADAACATRSCKLEVDVVSSTDGGSTWTQPLRLAGPFRLVWLPLTTQGYMYGDYTSTTVPLDKALPIFVAARSPDPPLLDVPAFAGRIPLGPGVAAVRSGGTAGNLPVPAPGTRAAPRRSM